MNASKYMQRVEARLANFSALSSAAPAPDVPRPRPADTGMHCETPAQPATELPPAHPLPPKQLRQPTEPVRFALPIPVVYYRGPAQPPGRRLPRFEGTVAESESIPATEKTAGPPPRPESPLKTSTTLREHLADSLRNPAALVYERLSPESVPTAERKSMLFTELFDAKKPGQGAAGRTFGEEELETYYSPRGKQDATLVFESRFESGNLGMAIKVRA